MAQSAHVGVLDAVYALVQLSCFSEAQQCFEGCAHYCLEVGAMVDGEGEAGKGHEGVARKHYAPREARYEEHVAVFAHIELFGAVFEAVEE